MAWTLVAAEARLHGGAPWWQVRNGLPDALPSALPAVCDVLIVGAGITGALVADHLAAVGKSVVIVDRRIAASGSTAASTALLQYELDLELLALADAVGLERAQRVYRRAYGAIAAFESLAAGMNGSSAFARRSSVYLASRHRDVARLKKECDARNAIGIDAEFWTDIEIAERYNLPGHGAIVSSQAAVVDPVRLSRQLLARAADRGAVLLEWTTALQAEQRGNALDVTTSRGTIRAEHVILACGYETPDSIPSDQTTLHSTFALITDPLPDAGPIAETAVVWESARPYSYLRNDGARLIVGGRDVRFRNDIARDALLPVRTRQLEQMLHALQPQLATRTAYSWTGTFAETEDSMPIIGPLDGTDRIHCALGYGGNGIVFSLIAAELLRDRCLGVANPDADLFVARGLTIGGR